MSAACMPSASCAGTSRSSSKARRPAGAVECCGLPCRSLGVESDSSDGARTEWPDDESALTGGIQRCRRRCLGPAGLVEGRGRLPEARRHDGSALGTPRGAADSAGTCTTSRVRSTHSGPSSMRGSEPAQRRLTPRSHGAQLQASLNHPVRTPRMTACRRCRRLNNQR